MSEFSKVVITNKGQALIAKLISGSDLLEFTEIQVSETAYSESQLEGLTALTNIKQSTTVTKVTRTDDVAVQVEGGVVNESLSFGYYMRTIGLLAEDPQDGEILFAVATAQQAGYMPPFNGKTIGAAHFNIVTTVGNSSNVTLQVDPAAVVTSYGDIQVLEGEISDLKSKDNELTEQLEELEAAQDVSVIDFGAVGDGVADDTDAIKAALAHMNTKYADVNNMFNYDKKRGRLVFPGDYEYKVSDTLTATGNYDIHILGPLVYVGADHNTMFTIGRENENIGGADYILGGRVSTSSTGVIGFELINIVYASILTKKIHGFHEGFRALATDVKGWYGNTITIGTFYANIIDIHITNRTNGWPNANVWIGGFFNKEANTGKGVQNFVKFSSLDGTYEMIDSNLFIGQSFEHGKGYCLPIDLRGGTVNKFVDLRVENVADEVLAIVNKRNNIIEVRGDWTTGTEIVSEGWQNSYVRERSEMVPIYDSGELAYTFAQFGDENRWFHPTLSFENIWGSDAPSSMSRLNDYNVTDEGLTLSVQNALVSLRFKRNDDRYFHVRIPKSEAKGMNFGVRGFDSSMVPLEESTPERIADPKWNHSAYMKSTHISQFYWNGNMPRLSTGSFNTGSDYADDWVIELHRDVKYFELYVRQGNTTETRDVTISRFKVSSDLGTAMLVDNSPDRDMYAVLGGKAMLTSIFDELNQTPEEGEEVFMPVVYDTGDLGKTAVMSVDDRAYHPTLTFDNLWSNDPRTLLSGSEGYALGEDGLQIVGDWESLVTVLEVHNDKQFRVQVESNDDKFFNMMFRGLGADKLPLVPLNNPAINVEPWDHNHYIKQVSQFSSFYVSTSHPGPSSTGVYHTGSDNESDITLDVHPDVKFIEVYIRQGNTAGTRDATIKRMKISSDKGNAKHVELIEGRNPYKIIGGILYLQTEKDGYLNLEKVGEIPVIPEIPEGYPLIYSTGSLGVTAKISPSLKVYHPTLAFKNLWNANPPTALTGESYYELSAIGAKIIATHAIMIVGIEVNDDNRFVVKVAKDSGKYVNLGFRALNASRELITPLSDAGINVAPWSHDHYIKQISDLSSFYVATDMPSPGAQMYQTGGDSDSVVTFEVHPSVKYVELYIRNGNTEGTRDATVDKINIYTDKGTARYFDVSTDRSTYSLVGGVIYSQEVVEGALTLTEV